MDQYGALDISLINDLPVFVDPFLLFNSKKPEYQNLHNDIIKYLRFLRDKSLAKSIRDGLLIDWFTFPEVKQNWLGYSLVGNSGSGLGLQFAQNLHRNLNTIFTDFGDEQISRSSHLEKLTLIDGGVGRDNISDFTTNLIKPYLLEYTQEFALKYLSSDLRKKIHVDKVYFNYVTESWVSAYFELPYIMDDYVVLTPKDILTKDEAWINRSDLISQFRQIVDSIPNEQLRGKSQQLLLKVLPEKPKKGELAKIVTQIIHEYPVLIEHFIKRKEDFGDQAVAISSANVQETEFLFMSQLDAFIEKLAVNTDFYKVPSNTLSETRQRVMYLKNVIENKGGHRLFYVQGQPIKRESDLQILFRLTWYGTDSDVSAEVNDGRGPADFKISNGAWDKTIVEFKLASNKKIKRNLQNQVEIYKKASDVSVALKVILFFSEKEHTEVKNVLVELEMQNDPNIILIDARADNKPSGSNA